MDLRGGQISVRELMGHPGARAVLGREFPGLVGTPMFRLAQGMSLNQVINRASGRVPKGKIQRVVDQLKAL